MEFLLVVIREARHRIPGLEFLLRDEGADWEQRRRLVARALELKQVTITAVLDTEDAQAEKAYRAWPLRLVVVSPTGRLEFDAQSQLSQASQWLEEHLRKPRPNLLH